jgi:hypothetical protein
MRLRGRFIIGDGRPDKFRSRLDLSGDALDSLRDPLDNSGDALDLSREALSPASASPKDENAPESSPGHTND